MALITQSIKNIIEGVSQQPPIIRHAEQFEEQINGFSTEAGGLQKRPPTLFIRELESLPTTSHITVINRDDTEQYIVAFTPTEVKVWDMQGNKKTVNYKDSGKTYITNANPKKTIKTVTIADTTFVLNMTVKPQMNTGDVRRTQAQQDAQGLLVNVKSGQYGRTYRIRINGDTIAEYKTPDGSQASHTANIDTNYIAGQLRSQAEGNGWSVSQGEAWLYIAGKQVNSFEVHDGYNNKGMTGIKDNVRTYTDLPASAPHDFTVLIKGESTTDDDYYVA